MIKYRFAVFALGLYAVLLPANALGGKGGPVEPPASALVRARAQFFQAIKERRWEDALRNADQRVRERAAKMGSAEALLRDVAPIDVLMKLADKEPIFSSYGKSLEGYGHMTVEADLPDLVDYRHPWSVHIKETSGPVELSFPLLPFKRFLELATQYDAERDAYTTRVQNLVRERLRGVSLRVETSKPSYGPGEKIMVRLVLVNPTTSTVYVNGNPSLPHFFASALRIIDPDGKNVPIQPPPPTQIFVGPIKAAPNSEKVLFDWSDAQTTYKFSTPGSYRLEFTGSRVPCGAVLATEEAKPPPYPAEFKNDPLLAFRDPGYSLENDAPSDFVPDRAPAAFRIEK